MLTNQKVNSYRPINTKLKSCIVQHQKCILDGCVHVHGAKRLKLTYIDVKIIHIPYIFTGPVDESDRVSETADADCRIEYTMQL